MAPPPPPPPPPSLVDEFLDSPASLGALAAVVLLLVGYGWWAWKRKKAQQSRFQDSVMGAPPAASLGASSVFSGAASQNVDTGAAVSQASVSDSSVGAIDADEVDPIAEADVYMAYGRDTQAEEILKDALNKDPNRLAIHSKLLEIYAARRDVQNLEQTAMKIKELTGGEGEDWDKAIVLGRTTDPGNALYGGDPEATVMVRPAAPAAAAAPTLDFDLDAAAPRATPDIALEGRYSCRDGRLRRSTSTWVRAMLRPHRPRRREIRFRARRNDHHRFDGSPERVRRPRFRPRHGRTCEAGSSTCSRAGLAHPGTRCRRPRFQPGPGCRFRQDRDDAFRAED